jgi:penicillin-binding protein 1A
MESVSSRLAFLRMRLSERWRETRPAARVVAIGVPVLALLLAVAWSRCLFMGCPDVHRLASYQPGGASVLVDRSGKAFADLAPVEGELVRLPTLPKYVPEAFIAVEDQRFRDHGAIDLRRVLGAVWSNVRAGGVQEGSSTLTMQLARNVFPEDLPGQERTLGRKVLEVRVAQEIEDTFSKDEILEMYLNHIYFGNGARGIEAASRHYFGRGSKDLTLPQAALLAAMPKAPSHYDPRRHPREARERRDLVLSLMAEQRRITSAEKDAAVEASLSVVPKPRAQKPDAPFAAYFVEEVRRELEDRLGDDFYAHKLRVHTTLDSTAQKAAEEELERQLRAIEGGALGGFSGPRYAPALQVADDGETPYLQGAVVALDAATGDVLAWVGGRDFLHSRFDRVKSARRQAGSAFKPFVYATAVASGRMLNQKVLDQPLQVSLGGRRAWTPKNFDGTFDGEITLRDALVRSKNVPTVRLAQDVGTHRIAELAEQAGIEPPIPEQPSMALGTVAVSPVELAAAYTAFAGLGEGVRPRFVVRVDAEDGKVLWQADEPERKHVLDAAVAYVITDALEDVLTRGTGTAVRESGFKAPAAGKTGTTSDGADTWFVGYTPEIVAAVWMGFDRQRPIMAKATGGRLAAPVWARLMTRIYAGRKVPAGWPMPAGVVEGLVDPQTGLLLASGCAPWSGAPYKELFVQGAVPVTVCPSQGPIMTADMLPLPPLPLPDYEDGMETGVPLEEVPPASTPGGEPVRLGDGTTATEPMRSYTPSSPAPATTPEPSAPSAVSATAPTTATAPATPPAARPSPPSAVKPAAPPAEEPRPEEPRSEASPREASPDPAPSPTPSPGLFL